jgi:hypothetical protein
MSDLVYNERVKEFAGALIEGEGFLTFQNPHDFSIVHRGKLKNSFCQEFFGEDFIGAGSEALLEYMREHPELGRPARHTGIRKAMFTMEAIEDGAADMEVPFEEFAMQLFRNMFVDPTGLSSVKDPFVALASIDVFVRDYSQTSSTVAVEMVFRGYKERSDEQEKSRDEQEE